METAGIRVGIDIGGTFTDVVISNDQGIIDIKKIPTTRGQEDVAVAGIVADLRSGAFADARVARFVHGTTVATNAVLERKGARVGLITTRGFRDVISLGRQNRQDLYDLNIKSLSPTFLSPDALRVEVTERIAADGSVVTALDRDTVRSAVEYLKEHGAESFAVCLLFSYLNPTHEIEVREIIRSLVPDAYISISSEVDPGSREFERSCATAFDAYVKPGLHGYLNQISRNLVSAGVEAEPQIMMSRGGVNAFASALDRPGRLFLSGPAAGVIGGLAVGKSVTLPNLITIDIGGTSSDIALIENGNPSVRTDGLVDGYTVRSPMVDVNAIGAGGGSIAWLDDAGGLRVGPQSAGAVPGPASYGRGGTEATVTDASIILGYIDPNFFAGGTLRLNRTLAEKTLRERIAEPLGLSLEGAALGVHRVINAQMSEGIRLVSVKRGADPRHFTLLPLGGGGGIHATALADELGIESVAVPLNAGVLSAVGLLTAPVEHEAMAAFYRTLATTDIATLDAKFAELDRQCSEMMQAEGDIATVEINHIVDMCYVGQSYHLQIPVPDNRETLLEDLYERFLKAHDYIYGHSERNEARIDHLRSVHRAPSQLSSQHSYRPNGEPKLKGKRLILLSQTGAVEAGVFDRLALDIGEVIAGPAILEQNDTTTIVGLGWTGTVAPDGTIIMRKEMSI